MAGKNKAAWGIDVGQYGFRAMKLEQTSQGLQAADFAVIDYPESLASLPTASHDQVIRQAITEFLAGHNLKGAAVVVGVPGRNSQARFVALPPVEPKKIPQIVEFEAKQQIPFDISDVVWDYQAISMTDSPDVIAGIFFIKRDVLDGFLSNFQHANILTDQVQVSPMALYNALVYDGLAAPEGATVILDIGSANSEFIVADGQKVFHRTIPVGGNNFTQALVKTFKLSFAKAENLKRKCATSKYAKQVFQAMRSVFSDLSSEVQRSMGFYTTLNREAKLTRLLAMGNTFRLPGLQKYLQQSLKMELIRVDQFSRLSLGPRVKAPAFSANVLGLGVAYGLALQGMGLAQININLLPPQIVQQQLWRAKKPVFAAAVALLAAMVVGLYGRHAADHGVLEGAANDRETLSVIKNGEKYKREFSEIETQIDQKKKQVSDLSDLAAQREVWPAITRVVTGAIVGSRNIEAEYAKQRSERRLIFLQSLTNIYTENLEADYKKKYGKDEPASSAATAMPVTGYGYGYGTTRPADAKKGYIVELRGITPFLGDNEYNGTYDFLVDQLINSLLQEAQNQLAALPEKSTKFTFSKPEISLYNQVKDIASERRSSRRPGGRPSTPNTTAVLKVPDPVMQGESMAEDMYFVMHWMVTIGDPADESSSKSSRSSASPPGSRPAGRIPTLR